MLTPSTRATIRPRTLPFAAMPFTQTRTIFGWKPRLASYDSHLDPLYPRFIRHRTLKTRAKLLKTIRRRQQFDWNAEVKPIVGPKHVRYASHWDGTNRPKWVRYSEKEEKQGKEETNADAYELSDKERAWRKQMEAMRKRIEADPYEAVFGKRFEPFWSPLFPQGTKDEVGSSGKAPEKSADPVDGNDRREKTTPVSPSTWKPETAAKATGEIDKTRQIEPCTYSSSTSWDSQSNKTKRPEWDSISRKTTNYEYDPVSNRMVPIPSSPPARSQQEPINVPAHVTWKPIVAKPRSSINLTTTNVDKVDAKVGNLEHTEAAMVGQKASHSTDGNVQSPKPQFNELDTLTAIDVRASMGKPKRHERAEEAVSDDWVSEQQALKQQIRDWDNSVTKLKSQVSAIVDEVSATQLGAYLPTTLDRRAQAPKPVEPVKPLQSAVQRMQSKAEPEPFDLDDAAAHESTEPIVKPASVPKDWDEQADILQSDRVMRTRGPQSPTMRWLEDMDARRAAYKKQKAVAAAEQSALVTDKTAELEKANAVLQAEVASQRLAMSEQQDRSAHKIRSLRDELETAYKQSSIHADAFRDHIAGLDKELTAAKSNANEVQVKAIKERYSKKVAGLQKELERAYVQSSVHADEFTKRIKELEGELVRLTKGARNASTAKPVSKESKLKDMRGEGDFCPNVTKFADSEMWYKQPSSSPQSSNRDSFKAEQKARDMALVSEVKSIYESAYGPVDTDHRQTLVAQDAALESALARFNKHAKYAFKNDGLEEELAGNVISAAGDAIKQEKLAYIYRKDKLEAEAELAQRVKVEAQKRPGGEYAYKRDCFEPTSQNQNKPSTTKEPRVKYVQDDLEAELVQQGKSAEVYEPVQKFVPDNLEAELKGEAAPSSVPSEKFRPDDLEVELQKQSRSVDAGETSQRFVPDNLEAELKDEAAPSSAQSEKFKPDDLELELQKQSKSAGVCEPSQRFVPDTLEAELKDQSETAAASHHSGAFKPDGLEAELVKKFNYADAKLDNLEAELKGGLEAATSLQPSEKFKPDELEAELQKRDEAPVSTQRSERFMPGALEAELKRLAIEKPAYASDEYAAEAAKPSRISKMELAMAESLGSELDMPLESVTSTSDAAPSVQSQQLPFYKIIEYDLKYDSFSTATTSSWGTTAPETSISRSQALAQLDTPRRWIQHFPFLKNDTCMLPKQWRGYQIVDARGNVLVMRKSQHAQKVAEPLKTSAIAAKQPETQSAVNPIDGTRSSKDVHAATGDYASPTGYVNLDLAEDLAAKSKAKDISTSTVATDGKDSGIPTKGSRIIKRQEPVFSGARRDRRADRRAKHAAKRESRRLPQQLEPYRGPGWGIFVFSMTLTTGLFMYLIGYLAEKGSTGRRELELKAAEAKQAEASKTEKANAGKWRLDDAMWQRK